MVDYGFRGVGLASAIVGGVLAGVDGQMPDYLFREVGEPDGLVFPIDIDGKVYQVGFSCYRVIAGVEDTDYFGFCCYA